MEESTNKIIRMLSNAQVTHTQSRGHKKVLMNEFLIDTYKDELALRNEHAPLKSALYKLGTFNGPGSY